MCGAAPRPDEPISQALLHNRVEIIEILIPGKRCGLIIGKGGETIKGLAETYGVKLVVIQESDTPLHLDKPLRITGEPEKVARCKEAVLALLNDQNAPVKTTSQAAPTPAVITSDYGTRMHSSNYYKPSQATIKVPWDKTGHVIGRGRYHLVLKQNRKLNRKQMILNSEMHSIRAHENWSMKFACRKSRLAFRSCLKFKRSV